MDADLQRIVNLVVERLRAMPALETPTFEISRNVVTLADIEGHLENIEAVQVAQRAVVTPAVRDVLHDKKIKLVYGSDTSPAGSIAKNEVVKISGAKNASAKNKQPTLLLAIAETKISPALAAACLPNAAGAVVLGENKSLTEVVRELSEQLRDGAKRVVLLTEQPHAAVCWANRHDHVCAAAVSQITEWDSAKRSLDINWLVLNPEVLSVYLLRTIIKRFSAG